MEKMQEQKRLRKCMCSIFSSRIILLSYVKLHALKGLASRKGVSSILCPLAPPSTAGLAGHLPVKKQEDI
jgi:hypothetical protein